MEFKHASPNIAINHVGTIAPEAFDRGIWPNKDSISMSPQSPFASFYTNQAPHTQHAAEAVNATSPQPPSALVVGRRASQPDLPKAKSACLRCRGKKSRCSGQRPCGGCTNDGLDCIWDDDKAKQKRDGRKNSTDSKRRVAKGKNSILQVRSACTRCQHRKAKCTGTRPACAYCVERQLECTYDVAEGETRTNDLKRKLRDSEIRAQAFGRILAVMREGNIYQATEVLARLRIGGTPRDILQSLPTSIASPSPRGEPLQSGLERRFST
ncbi:hypothetical protein Q7P35_003912 [Cladosporium inversicolor]